MHGQAGGRKACEHVQRMDAQGCVVALAGTGNLDPSREPCVSPTLPDRACSRPLQPPPYHRKAGFLVPCEGEDAAVPRGAGLLQACPVSWAMMPPSPQKAPLSAGHIAGVGLPDLPGVALHPRLSAPPFLPFSIQPLPAEAWQGASHDLAGSINPARASCYW